MINSEKQADDTQGEATVWLPQSSSLKMIRRWPMIQPAAAYFTTRKSAGMLARCEKKKKMTELTFLFQVEWDVRMFLGQMRGKNCGMVEDNSPPNRWHGWNTVTIVLMTLCVGLCGITIITRGIANYLVIRIVTSFHISFKLLIFISGLFQSNLGKPFIVLCLFCVPSIPWAS